MKKLLSSVLLTALAVSTFGQVGINTETPHSSSDLELGSSNKALYLNRVANTGVIANPQPGMLVYDLEDNCVKAYQGDPGAWSDCLAGGNGGSGNGSVTSFDCGAAVWSPATLTVGTVYTGSGGTDPATLTIPYTGGTDGSYAEHTFTTNGLTFTLPAGTISGPSGNLVYYITGSPITAGTLSVDISYLGGSCTSADGNAITTTVDPGEGSVSGLDCSAALSPSAIAGETSYTGTFSVSYTGGDGGSYAAQTLSSSPAGFTATLAAGSFENGGGSVTYTVTAATVPAAGDYTFALTLGGENCTKTITVTSAAGILNGVTLVQDRMYFVASVYDQDYLPYEIPTMPATTDRPVAADGTNDAVTVDVQGSITTEGVPVQIPVASVTGTGSIGAWTSTFVVPAELTEDGNSRTLQLSWSSQTYDTSTKYITATIKSLGDDLLARKLDINAGIGNDYIGVPMGTFKYPYNNAGTLTDYQVRDIAGIPDKMFGQDINDSNQQHNFLYLPVQAEDGNIWLNNNLGADYANVNHGSFDPSQQAMAKNDHHAYGSKFQWGRKPDGHELITWTSATAGTSVYGTTATKSDEPANSLFIRTSSNPREWRVNRNDTLWATESAANNPCPRGFRVPTQSEWENLITAAGITNNNTSYNSSLKLTVAGVRGDNGTINMENRVYHWSSTAYDVNSARDFVTVESAYDIDTSWRSMGLTVRCIKD